MNLSDDKIENVLKILYEEVVPAQGCTEPITLAFTAAKAKEIIPTQEISKVIIKLSGNMIKNVKSVVVPNSGGLIGIEVATIMGLLFGDASKDLMVISNITSKQMDKVKEFIETKEIQILQEETNTKLYVNIEIFGDKSCASVEIKHFHTNITKMKKNEKVILHQSCNDKFFNTPYKKRETLSIELIYNIAKIIDIAKIKPLMLKVIELNSKIANEGLTGKYGVNIGKIITEHIENGFYGDDVRNRAAAFASAGSDARMSGCSLPVMTTSGSGNQGMTSSLALIEYANIMKIDQNKLIRTLFFSHLATVHIKTNVGRLSAYCGVICSASAVAGALCFVNNNSLDKISHAIANTLGDVSGIICDGAKSSCAMKISTTIYAAFDAYILASHGKYLLGGDGIIAHDIEDTLKHIALLSQEGMKVTDEVIIDIMNHNFKHK